MITKLARYSYLKGLGDLIYIDIHGRTQGVPGRTKQAWYQLNGEE